MPARVQLSTIEDLRGQFDRGCPIVCRYRPRPGLPMVPRLVREITADGLVLLFGLEGRAVSIDAPWVERWEAYAPPELWRGSLRDTTAAESALGA